MDLKFRRDGRFETVTVMATGAESRS
jgi:hypothetical protein